MKLRKLQRIVESKGFKLIPKQTEHLKYVHRSGASVIIPNHPSKDLNKFIVKSIMKSIDKATGIG